MRGLGIGDWGLGIGDWAQSPIPNPQENILYIILIKILNNFKVLILLIYIYKFFENNN